MWKSTMKYYPHHNILYFLYWLLLLFFLVLFISIKYFENLWHFFHYLFSNFIFSNLSFLGISAAVNQVIVNMKNTITSAILRFSQLFCRCILNKNYISNATEYVKKWGNMYSNLVLLNSLLEQRYSLVLTSLHHEHNKNDSN